jgi:enoyl-CoA hydratase
MEIIVNPKDHLLIERDGPIITLIMNRPEAKNAFSLEMLGRMAEAWDMIDGDDSIRVAILTGAEGVFSSGADLKNMNNPSPDDPWLPRFKENPDLHWKSLLRHYRLKKPLIAAVEGYALGGGTEILQATDIRVAGEGASFAVSEVKWGLFPVGGSSVRLQRQIPFTKAMEMLLTGRRVPAEEAERIGLITRVVPSGQALAEAKSIAATIAENAPLAVQALKRSVLETASLSEEEGLKKELEIGWPIFGTEDAKEGGKAFAEKRPPVYQGK